MTEDASSRHCFAVLVDNEPGVLARVIGLFAGRGYNIQSLTVDEVDASANLSRITIVTTGAPMVIEQIKAQLGRLVPVRRVVNLTEQGKYVEHCTALVKVIGTADKLKEAQQLADQFGARIADKTGNATIFELTATTHQIDSFIHKIKTCGLVELVRTGSIAMSCGEFIIDVPTQDTNQRQAEG